MNTTLKLTGRLIPAKEGGYTGYFKQFPEAIAEGESVKEVKANMIEALSVILDYRNDKYSNNKGKVCKEVEFDLIVS